jgi:hypothetical protein
LPFDGCPFAALAALGREEHAIVTDGRYEDLPELGERRQRLLEALPADVPAGAVGHLREAARLQALITLGLTEARTAVGQELGRLGRTRAGVQGYGASTGSLRPAVDTAG